MYMHYWRGDEAGWFINMPLFIVPLVGLVLLAALWSLVWKGLALWHSAQRGEYWWFLALLLINTLGVLEIIYLFFFAKIKLSELFTKHPHNHSH
jgi:methionyl-tRNA synthetase